MADKKEIKEAPTIAPTVVMPEADRIVTIKIPRERKDQEDVVVWVNERRFLIKRGIAVDVPESVAQILEEREKMLEVSYNYEQAKSK